MIIGKKLFYRMEWVLIFLCVNMLYGRAQSASRVTWSFESERINDTEAILRMTAHISEGWHLYSQYLEQGGPQPTNFLFAKSDQYMLKGKTQENGEPHTWYDEIYEMNITQYSHHVVFLQRIRLTTTQTVVSGKVEYMVCNNLQCIPDEQQFSIHVR